MGLARSSSLTMTPGLMSKFALIISTSSSEDLVEVPYELIYMDNGSATPMAYESWTSTRRANFA